MASSAWSLCRASGTAGALGVYQSGLVGEYDGLYPVAEAQLGEDPAEVAFDGGLADVEGGGDLAVGHSLGDVDQDLPFAAGQLVQRGAARRLTAAQVGQEAGEVVEEPAGDAGGDDGVAAGDGADGVGEVGGAGVPWQRGIR